MDGYRVDIYYKGGLDSEKDASLRALGEKYGGKDVGSGMGLCEGERDIEWLFPSVGAASDFVKAAHAKYPGDLRHRLGWRNVE